MKRKSIMAILTLSVLLGACGSENGQGAHGETALEAAGTEHAESTGSTAADDGSDEADGSDDAGAAAGEQEEKNADDMGSGEISKGEVGEIAMESRTGAGPVNYCENAEPLTIPSAGITENQIRALSDSSLRLFARSVAEADAGENVLISPTSVIMAFGMTENGARGNTLAQMETVINGGLSVDEMNPLLYEMAERFTASEEVRWNVADSIWFKDDGQMRVAEDFAAKARSYYGADIWGAPFDSGTVKDINDWVKEETFGMIPSVLSQLDPDARMCLINAIAFEGEWRDPYEDSDIQAGQSFRNADGSRTDVTLLASKEDACFTLGQGTGFVRPYKGGQYSFVGILPDQGILATDYAASLEACGADFASAVKNAEYDRDVYVSLPEFSMDYAAEMSDMLRKMGMADAFDGDRADFTAMMGPTDPSADCDIWIGSVIHKTHIDVDREGTRAAAVTAITMEACMAVADYEEPVVIVLDRPFVYAIVDNATGLPVFLGCMNTME